MPNALYYGHNLDVLRDSIADARVDLIYLDPPFNSQASYNVLFKGPSDKGADGQIEAETESDIRCEMAYSIIIGSEIVKACIVENRGPYLVHDWNGIFNREARERLAPDRT